MASFPRPIVLRSPSIQVAKKLVRGDYKSGRVKDPTAKLSSRHEKTVKNYVKEFLDKALRKKEERSKHKTQTGVKSETKPGTPDTPKGSVKAEDWDDDMLDLKQDVAASHDASPADSASELKRKREEDASLDSPKRLRTDTDELPSAPPPPPPPPPPGGDMPLDAGEPSLTPLDGSFTISFPEVEQGTSISSKVTINANGHVSPMQLATPPTTTNGSAASANERSTR